MFSWPPVPHPLSPGLERVARDRQTMKDELEAAVRDLLKPVHHQLGRTEAKQRSRRTILREIGVLLVELAAFGLLRRTADTLDYVIRTYRTQPGDAWREDIKVKPAPGQTQPMQTWGEGVEPIVFGALP